MSGNAEHALAIANLKARYCFAADLAATDPYQARILFADIFTDDFYGEYGVEPLVGAGAITDFLCTAIAASSEWMIHMMGSPRIEIRGESATGDWTILVHSLRKEDGELGVIRGRYSDEFRLTEQGWRISKILFGRLG